MEQVNKNLFLPNTTVVVGLSGGPDSVCLLHWLVQQKDLGLTLIAAHLDHEWRPNSHKDVLFCKELCQKLGITFITQKASELPHQPKYNGSQEEVGRKLRRAFFEQVAQDYNANTIALGHHTGDQQETFFIRLMRGTTISGLGGMKEQDGKYVRPLLHVSKETIYAYLKKNNLSYLTDTTNNSEAFLRNRIRKHLIPALQHCDQRSHKQLVRIMHHLQETETFLQKQTQIIYKELTSTNELDTKELSKLDLFMQRRIIVYWLQETVVSEFLLTETFLDEILRFLLSPRGGTHQLSTQWSICKKQNKAVIQE